MATLFKNSCSPFYQARYFDANGKRISKSTGTTKKREATKIAAGFEADELDVRRKASQLPRAFQAIVESAAREAAADGLTLARAEELIRKLHKAANPEYEVQCLGDFWKAWIEKQRDHVTDSCAKGYDHDHDLFAAALGPRAMAAPLNLLTCEQIEAALKKAKKSPIAQAAKARNKEQGAKRLRRASTVNKALSSLRRVLDSAVAQGAATHNPAKECRALSEADSVERAPFAVEEIRAMLDEPNTTDEWKGAITIAAHTGLRLGDVLSLGRQHIDGRRIVIMPSKTAKKKKVITVPLTPPCLAWIGERKGGFFPKLVKQSRPKTSMQFEAIMRKAGVPKVIDLPGGLKGTRSFHALRHTFTSWLADADIHADVRQKLTGHSSSKIHQRYTHHDEALDRAVEALPPI